MDTSTEARGLFVKPSGEIVVRHVGGSLVTMPVGEYHHQPPEDELPIANDEADYNRIMDQKNA